MKCNITNGTHAHIGENQDVYKEEVRQEDGKIIIVQYYVSKSEKEDTIKRKTIILFILGL
jgi:hypothetical protein